MFFIFYFIWQSAKRFLKFSIFSIYSTALTIDIILADEKNITTADEEEIEIITLTDENGEDMDFEFLDLVEYEDKRYVVLLPPIEDVEGEDEDEDEEVLILQVEDDGTEENESYVFVDDDDILTAVFDIFKEKFKDEFDFAEE